ncbi:neuroglian-like [Mytilus galloprovincialis]|uniref:neuroglian-like n=1 Tax=Mytilus galloprovincialis TaxID=29158 RepID=UPI003F7C1B94
MKALVTVILFVVILSMIQCADPETPPQITSPFADSYYMKEDDDTPKTFKCSSSGNPAPTYEWRKDGKVFSDSLQISSDKMTGELKITKPAIQDFGSFQCFASNSHGSAMSAPFKVERAFIGSFTDTTLKDLPSAKQYTNVSIPCVGKPRCVPGNECKVEWKLGEGTSNTVDETKRIAVDKMGTLHFLYVDLEDTSSQAKPYACGMNNELMKAFYKGGDVIMTVIKQTNPSSVKPLALYSQDVKGLLGGEVELQCVFSGYPLPDIEWYSPENVLIKPSFKYSYRIPDVKRNLIIKQLSADDEGTYICKAINIISTAQANVYLNVTSKPRFPEGQIFESQVVPRGDNAVFRCNMESMRYEKRPSMPIWRRNGVVLNPSQIGSSSSQKYHLSDDGTILTIKDVQNPGDSCNIMCQTSNVIIDVNGDDAEATSYADAFLRVIDPITVQLLTQAQLEIDAPEPFSMAFSATTDPSVPKLIYKWSLLGADNLTYYDHNTLMSKPFVSFNIDMNNLTIDPAKVNMDNDDDKVRAVIGTYRVNISHTHDWEMRSFEITSNIKPATKAPIISSAGFDLWIIGVILGVIVLLIVVFFIICTLYRNRGGEYPVDKKEVAAGHDPAQELKDSGFADLSRADGEKTPFDKVSLSDDVKPLESDEDSMMGDYDDDADMTKFNEDGSFIGIYMDKKGLLHG